MKVACKLYFLRTRVHYNINVFPQGHLSLQQPQQLAVALALYPPYPQDRGRPGLRLHHSLVVQL